MSGTVQGYRVREPRVVARSAPPPRGGGPPSSFSSLAQAWAAFGEAKSVLEKLESSPPGNPNQERQSSSQSIFKSTKLSKSATHPASAQTASTKKASTQTASTPTASKETASTPTASKETAGSKTFTRDRASRHPASRHTASSSKTARSHETRLERKRYKDVSIPLWCGDPAPLTPTPHSRRSPTPGEPHPNSNGVPQPSKIDLAEDTLETLRSKVEAQKQALQETNSRLESFRRPLTSEPCVYPLPEVTQSSTSLSGTLPTVTTSHPHTTLTSQGTRRQPQCRKITSLPPPPAGKTTRITTGSSSQSSAVPRTTRTAAPRATVRKVTHLSPPADPLRSNTRARVKRSSVQPELTRKKQSVKREEGLPHTRSWALRPSASSVMAATAAVTSGGGEGVSSVQGEGVREGSHGREERGGKLRRDLAQLLQDLESSSGDEMESQREKSVKHPHPSVPVFKRRKLSDPENKPLPPPPQTKPYDPTEVQKYIRQKQRERRVQAQRKQEEETREKREREERRRELVQRQRRIVQANLRSRQRWRERESDPESGSTFTSSLVPPPAPSRSPSPPRVLTTHTSPRSTTSSLSPRTYTITKPPPVSGTLPPPPEEPIQTTVNQQSSHEDRILALTQSALELKKKISAEAQRLKKARSKIPTPISITVTTATPPPLSVAPPTLPGVGSVHRQARLAEEARRKGEAATRIQALFRGYKVRRGLGGASLGRVGDGEEETVRPNGVLKSPSVPLNNGVLKSPKVDLKTPSQSVGVQTSSSPLHLKPTPTAAPTATEETSKVATPPWEKGGGDPMSVINIFARERSQLKQTLSHLKTQRLSQLSQLRSSTPQDHTHNHTPSNELPSVEDASSSNSLSLISSAHSLSTHLEESPYSKSPSIASNTHSHTLTPSPKSQSSHSHSTPPPSHTQEEEVPAITPPESPSFVSSFNTANTKPRPPGHTPTTSDPSENPPGGRLSPRSLGLKLHAELTLLETIEESMRQLSAVEGSRAVTSARQESVSLAGLLDSQRMRQEREKREAASRERVAELEREKEMRRVREETERREKERVRVEEDDLARQRREISQQLAEARAVASEAVISSARLQVEAAHNMAVSVATAAAKEAVSAAMVGVVNPPLTPPRAPPTKTTPSDVSAYSTDFEGTIQPDSLTEENTHTGGSLLVPATRNSSGESTLTPGEVGGVSQASVPEEEIDGDTELKLESSFRELLPSESHRRRHSRTLSLAESESRPSSPAHTPSSHPGDRSPSPFTAGGGEDSFLQFMTRMMEQYMKEEEVRSRHRALLLQLREKTLKERTKAEMEWLQMKQNRLRGKKGADEDMPSLESRQRGLLRQLETEQAEIRRLQKAQKAASRERRLMLEQHRAISNMQSSAKYYRNKLRRHSAQDHLEHPFTASPTHYHSPSASEVASQVSEEDVVSPIPSQLSCSPSPTPSHISSSSHNIMEDQSVSVAMPTDTGNTTPTVVRQLKDHDKYLRQKEEKLRERRRVAEETLRSRPR